MAKLPGEPMACGCLDQGECERESRIEEAVPEAHEMPRSVMERKPLSAITT